MKQIKNLMPNKYELDKRKLLEITELQNEKMRMIFDITKDEIKELKKGLVVNITDDISIKLALAKSDSKLKTDRKDILEMIRIAIHKLRKEIKIHPFEESLVSLQTLLDLKRNIMNRDVYLRKKQRK